MKFQTSHVLMFLLIFDYVYHTLAIQLKQPGKNHKNDDSDPFSSIGIPELDAKQILDEIDKEKHKEPVSDELNTIDDLPNFLKYSKLSDDDAMAVLTRFLLQDDVSLKDLGAVYDHTGFDGMKSQVKALPEEPEERAFVRARSAATIYVRLLT